MFVDKQSMHKQTSTAYIMVLFLFLTLGIFSCQRAVDTEVSKISITLPGNAPLAENASISKIIYQSTKVSALGTAADSSDQQQSESFLDIVPTGYSVATGAYPINCYLVTLVGPEAFLKANYCGGKNSDGTVNQDYSFGTFIGLRPAGSVLEFDAPPGDNRQIMIFGLHSTDPLACTDLLASKPSKTNFSKPQMLGISAAMKFNAGQSIVVPVDLSSPSTATQVDDCVLNNDQRQPVIANAMAIENRSFPYNVLRLNLASSISYTCEPLDIQFKSVTATSETPGILAQSIAVSIQAAASTVPGAALSTKQLFSTYSECNTPANLTGSLAVVVPLGAVQHRVWARFASADQTDMIYTPTTLTAASGLQGLPRTFGFAQESSTFSLESYVYDSFLPRMIQPNQCIPIKVSLLKPSGFLMSGSTGFGTNFNITATDSTNTSIDNSFFNDSGCTSFDSTTTVNSPLPSVPMQKTVYFKLPSSALVGTSSGGNGSMVSIQIAASVANARALPFKQFINVQNPPTNYIPAITQMRVAVKSYFPSFLPPSGTSTALCIPLNIQLMDQAGFLMNTPAGGAISILPAAPNDLTGLSLNSDNLCASAISLNGVTGNYDIPYVAGAATTTVYLKTTPGFTPGLKSATVVYNNILKRTVYFTLTNPLY